MALFYTSMKICVSLLYILIAIVVAILTFSVIKNQDNVTTNTINELVADNPQVQANTQKKGVYTAVRAATTVPIDLDEEVTTIDAVDLEVGDRVIVQFNTKEQNGIYDVDASFRLVRAPDLDTNAQVAPGVFVQVQEGAVYGNQVLMLTSSASSSRRKRVSAGLNFQTVTSNVLPKTDTSLTTALTRGSDGTIEWSRDEVVFAPSTRPKTDAVAVFTGSNSSTSSTNVTIDTGDNVKNATSFGLINDVGQEFNMQLSDSVSVDDPLTVNFPTSSGPVGTSLTVTNLVDNVVDLEWQFPAISVANTVVVSKTPTAGQFNNIAAALASITGQSPSNRFLVSVEPGQYSEDNLIIPRYVSIQGTSQNVCFINGGATNSVLVMTGGSNATNLTITSQAALASNVPAILMSSDNGDVLVLDSVVLDTVAVGIHAGPNTAAESLYRLFNVRINDVKDVGVSVDGTGAVLTNVKALGLLINTVNTANTQAVNVKGPNGDCFLQASELVGDVNTNGTAIVVDTAGHLTCNGVEINRFAVGVHVPVQVGAPLLIVEGGEIDNTPLAINVEDDECSGHYGGFVNANLIQINPVSSFFRDNKDPRILTVDFRGGDFNSVQSAIDYILNLPVSQHPTADSNIVVKVGPGVFVENPLTLLPFTSIIGSGQNSTTIAPTTPNTTLITLGEGCVIAGCTVVAPAGASGQALLFTGGSNTTKIDLRDITLQGTDTLCTLCRFDTTAAPASYNSVLVVNCEVSGLFGTGFDLFNDVAGLSVRLLVINLSYFNLAPLTQEQLLFHTHGTESIFGANTILLSVEQLNVSDFLVPTGQPAHVVGIQIDSTVTLYVTSSKFGDLKRAIRADSTVDTQIMRISYCQFVNINPILSTTGIQIDKPDAVGAITAIIDKDHVFLPATSLISVNLQNPLDGTVSFSGTLSQGDDFACITNVSEFIQKGSTLGLTNGGTFSNTLLDATISAGAGYLLAPNGTLKFVSWTSPLNVTLTADSAEYLYVDNTGTLFANTNEQDDKENIFVGRTRTNATDVVFFQSYAAKYEQGVNACHGSTAGMFGSVFKEGCVTSVNGTVQVDVSEGTYFYGNREYTPSANVPVTFYPIYNGGITIQAATSNVNLTQYDLAGTLTAIPTSEYAKHMLFIVGDGTDQQYLFVYAQSTNAVLNDAELPTPPSYFGGNTVRLAAIVVQEGVANISSIEDLRPLPTFISQSQGGGDVTVHNDLTGRDSLTAHTQYLLRAGDTMTGTLDMGSQNITNAGTINAIDISTISSRLVPVGADPLPTAVVSELSDSTNTEGSSNSFANSGHIHAHGNRGGGSLHALATGSVHGFMSSGDKTILDAATSSPSANILAQWGVGNVLNAQTFNTLANGGLVLEGTTESVTLQALAGLVASYTMSLPPNLGSSGEFLQTDGAGGTVWTNPTLASNIIKVRSSNTTLNINNTATPVVIPWDVTPDIIDSAYTVQVGNEDIRINSAGRYEVYFNLVYQVTDAATRLVPDLRIRVNTVNVVGQAFGGYIRNSSGNTTGSGGFTTVLNLSVNDLISITSVEAANVGTLNMIANQSTLIIKSV